jgi:6-phosphogluconolactonase
MRHACTTPFSTSLAAYSVGKQLLVANYVSGSIAVLPVKEDGSLGEAVDRHQLIDPIQPQIGRVNVFSAGIGGDHMGVRAIVIADISTGWIAPAAS